MIESEEKKKRLIGDIEHWSEFTKIKQYLRIYDIPNLVNTILEEFYHVTLCCGHKVNSIHDGVNIEFYTYENNDQETTIGLYCKDCAEKFKRELGAWEVE